MWTDSDSLAQWWGPEGFTAPSIAVDVRPGGRYRIEMQPPAGERFFLAGEFCAIDAPEPRLTYTFHWEDPDPDDQETVVRLTLADLGESTDLTVDQGPFRTEQRAANSTRKVGPRRSTGSRHSSRGSRPRRPIDSPTQIIKQAQDKEN